MNLFSLQNITVKANGQNILNNFSADSGNAQFVCIIGPNGAGKSTLMQLFHALIFPNCGEVRILGTISSKSTALSIRRRSGYVSQIQKIDRMQPISVFESVLCGTYGKLGFFKKPGKHEKEIALSCLEAVGLIHLKDRPVGYISGGESQKMAIARALATQPEMMLLDEPYSALDWQAKNDFLDLIRDLYIIRKIPIVMVTHNINDLNIGICERVICVKDGTLYWQGKTSDALNPDLLSRLFNVPKKMVEHCIKP